MGGFTRSIRRAAITAIFVQIVHRVLLRDLARQPLVLGVQDLDVVNALQHHVDLAQGERLGEVVVRPESHGLDGRVERSEAGDERIRLDAQAGEEPC